MLVLCGEPCIAAPTKSKEGAGIWALIWAVTIKLGRLQLGLLFKLLLV